MLKPPPYATDFETIATRSNFVSALHGASLQHIQRTHDEARFIAVIGNYHGSRSITAFPDELGGSESIRAAHFLGASVETVMLGHELGGRYGCNFDGCGINEVQNLIGPWPGFDRTVNTGPAVPVRPLQGSPYCETALE